MIFFFDKLRKREDCIFSEFGTIVLVGGVNPTLPYDILESDMSFYLGNLYGFTVF